MILSDAAANLALAKDHCYAVMCTLEVLAERLREIDNGLSETQDGNDSGLSAVIGALKGQITAISDMTSSLDHLDEVVAKQAAGA